MFKNLFGRKRVKPVRPDDIVVDEVPDEVVWIINRIIEERFDGTSFNLYTEEIVQGLYGTGIEPTAPMMRKAGKLYYSYGWEFHWDDIRKHYIVSPL
jgi:hypothetical protein